jgi:hypothetical protein
MAVAILCVTWWLFRSVETRMEAASMRASYFFGRATRLDLDANGDGQIDEQWIYSWRHPAVHHELPLRIQSDRNHDGQWDTWITPEDRHDLGTYARYEADLDSDGDPDWHFREKFASGRGTQRIAERRGY